MLGSTSAPGAEAHRTAILWASQDKGQHARRPSGRIYEIALAWVYPCDIYRRIRHGRRLLLLLLGSDRSFVLRRRAPLVVAEVSYLPFDTASAMRRRVACSARSLIQQSGVGETDHRWHGRPSSQVIWLRRQYRQAWLTFLRLPAFFFLPSWSSWSLLPALSGRSCCCCCCCCRREEVGPDSGAALLESARAGSLRYDDIVFRGNVGHPRILEEGTAREIGEKAFG